MSKKKEEMITRLIIDYYEYGSRDNKPEYTQGYAEATMNMIQTVIDLNIDPPGLE